MADIKGPVPGQIQRPLIPTTPAKGGKVGAPEASPQAAALQNTAALSKLEQAALSGSMAAATASINASASNNVLGSMKAAQTASTAGAADIPQSALSLEALCIPLPAEASAAGTFSGLPQISAKDRKALSSELANVFDKLSDKLGEAQANKLKTIIQNSESIKADIAANPELEKTLQEAVRLGKELNDVEGLSAGESTRMASMSANQVTGDVTSGVQDLQTRLNGAGGKAFGEIGDMIGKGGIKGLDLSNMPIEDAIQMMFMLISEDARKDTKELLLEMDGTRKHKAALREAGTMFKEQMAASRQQAREYYDDMVKDMSPEEKKTVGDFDSWLKTQSVRLPTVEIDAENGKAIMKDKGGFVTPEGPHELTPEEKAAQEAADAAALAAAEAAEKASADAAAAAEKAAKAAADAAAKAASDAAAKAAADAAKVAADKAKAADDAKKPHKPHRKETGVGGLHNRKPGHTPHKPTEKEIPPKWRHEKQYDLSGKIPKPGDPRPEENPLGVYNIKESIVDLHTQDLGAANQGGNGVLDLQNQGVLNIHTDAAQGAKQFGANGLQHQQSFQEVSGTASRLESEGTPPQETGGNITSFEGGQNELDKLNDAKDSLSEQSESMQLKMQMYMDRMTKADSARSNTMKKFSEIASQIIGNWK